MLNSKQFIFSLIAWATATLVMSQATNSPYSRYGYGQLASPALGASKAMGGAAIGSRDNSRINNSNPASYSGIDSTTFLFDFGVSTQIGYFSENTINERKFNGNIEYVSIQFPLAKNIGASVGLLPYSYVGYDFGNIISNSTPNLSGATSYNGSGGLSQVYLGFAVAPFQGLSVGVNANYIFGTISNSSTTVSSDGKFSTTYVSHELRSRGFKPDFGLQCYRSFGKESKLSLGLTYSQKINLNTVESVLVDTVKTLFSNKYELAETYGIGANWQINNKWTVASDLLCQNWGKAQFAGKSDSLYNRLKLAAGFEFLPNAKGRHFYERVRYRMGASVSNNYLNVRNQKINEYGVSMGVGIPFKTSKSILNLSVDYSKLTPNNSLFVKESYLRFSVNLTVNEFWFFKRKID